MDLAYILENEEQWQKEQYVIIRNRQFISCEDPPPLHRGKYSADVRKLRGITKLLKMCTDEDLYDLDLDRATFARNFFHKDDVHHLPGLIQSEDCMNHLKSEAHWALYLTLLAFFPEIVAAREKPVTNFEELMDAAMSYFELEPKNHFPSFLYPKKT